MDSDPDDDHGMLWEDEAEEAVQHVVEHAEEDELRGTVTVFSTDDHHYDTEADCFEDLTQHLVEVYNEHWYANVPFEGGEAVFESDAEGFVAGVLGDTEFEEFFIKVEEPEEGERILASYELVKSPIESRLIRRELASVSDELMEYFAKHPEKMKSMDRDDFQKLMATIYRNQGFDVYLHRQSGDGGIDMQVVQKSSLGALLTFVQCKRPDEPNKVGVDVVRSLHGVVTSGKATRGLVATTSTFTQGAVAFRDKIRHQMTLTDFNQITAFLKPWRR